MTDNAADTRATGSRSPLAARLAIAVAVLGVLAALGLSLVPTSAGPAKCGWWFNPHYSASNAAEADHLDELADQLGALGDQSSADEAHQTADAARLGYVWCSGKLDNRRTWSFVALGAAVVLPVAIVFVAGRRRVTQDA